MTTDEGVEGSQMDYSAQGPLPAVGLGDRLVCGLVAAATAFERLAAAPSRQAAISAPDLVRTIVSEVVPRLQAEVEVLVPAFARLQVPADSIAGFSIARPEAGILAEQLSRIADNIARADDSGGAYVKRMAGRLADLLRQHVALELSLVCEFLEPNFGHTEADRLLLSLSVAEDRARDALVFVAPPTYLPTEAHVLRHNPRSPRLVRLRDTEEA